MFLNHCIGHLSKFFLSDSGSPHYYVLDLISAILCGDNSPIHSTDKDTGKEGIENKYNLLEQRQCRSML